MKKLIVVSGSLLLLFLQTSAQDTAARADITSSDAIENYKSYEGTVEFQKTKQPATIIEFPFSPSVTEEAIKNHFSGMGIKVKEYKGFMLAKGVKLSSSDADFKDIYYKVERKSRKERDISLVYVITANPEENIGTKTSAGGGTALFTIAAGAAGFVEGLGPHVNAYNHELKIQEQEEGVKKAERKYKNLVERSR
ncbi:MAG: hypothetical protein HC867_07580 [Bacteroidia bacterium]|nr:hypothetical protein [Bacteroidia bacterium]